MDSANEREARMDKKAVMLTAALAGSAVILGGCMLAAVGAGAAGTVAYVRGDLEVVEAHKLDDVYEATKKALDELELSVTTDNKDKISAQVVARDSQDKKVKVRLSAVTDEATKISIRHGVFGDELKSRLVYDKIKENLR